MTKFYVDGQGNYLGGFDGAEPPQGAVEVPAAPTHAAHKWTGSAWAEVPTLQTYTDAVQAHLDATARSHGYDGILSGASYAGDQNPTFDAEGTALKAWRSSVWAACYVKMAEVQGGAPAPTIAELIAALPLMVWP